jgi:site-specific recombinase XerD
VRPRIGPSYRRGLVAYLAWLYLRGELGFDPRCLKVHQRVELPTLALEYLRLFETTHRPGTCSGHRNTLQAFYDWLFDAHVELARIDRAQIECWLVSLNDRRLAAATRRAAVLQIRSYLRWLFERGELKFDPEHLLRRSDLPRLPTYLPRPLQPDTDRELQHRLASSDSPLWRALWLARQTGVRIGELADLELDCIRTDVAGRSFIKVPLGKLANERLVPLTPHACEHIEWLRQRGPHPRELLLERPNSREALMITLRRALAEAAEGLHDPARITPHRLRHTFATSLLAGGMSLVGIMRLLGHRDFRMTLRYAAVSQELVAREYFEALSTISTRYALPAQTSSHADIFDPIKALNDIVLFINSRVACSGEDAAPARALCKRLLRIQDSLRAVLAHGSPDPATMAS